MKHTFRRWLILQKEAPISHLGMDVKADPAFPRTAKTINTYRRYLSRMNACDGALSTLEVAWKKYQEYLAA
jgi:uncharacterized protein YozE (UPF0346 family)